MVNGSWQSVYNGGYSVSGNLFAASGNYVYYKNENSYLPIMYKKDSGGQAVLLGNVSFSSQANFTDSNQNRNEMLTHDFEICGAVPTIAYTRAGKAAVRRFVDDWSNWNSINISESDVTKVMIKSGTNGRIYLAYNNKISTSTTSDTKITVKELLTNTGTWQTVGGVNFSMQAGVQFDFKLNNANEPYVLYMSGRVQKFDGTNWVFVGGSAYTGDIAARLGIDTNNIPYIAFIDPSNSNHIAVKKLNGNAWDYVDQAGLSGYTGQQYRPRIVIDASNTIYLGFVDNLLRVHIKKLNNGLWESVGPDFFTTQKTDQFEMTVDNNNVLHIIYNEQHDNFRSEANVKKFNGTDWEYVGAPNFSPASIVVGKLDFSQNNTPVVAYSSNVSGGLMIDTRFFDAGTLSNEVYNPIENWTVTPNPVTAQFSINRSSEIESLEIYDVTGKKIKSLYENFTNIDVSFLSSGLYILKIKTEGGTNSIKLIKN